MKIEIGKEELLHLIALVGNSSSMSATHRLYQKLEDAGIEEFGQEFKELAKKVDTLVADVEPMQYNRVEQKVSELAD